MSYRRAAHRGGAGRGDTGRRGRRAQAACVAGAYRARLGAHNEARGGDGVATAVQNLWLGELRRAGNAFRGIGPIAAGAWHTWGLHGHKGGTGTIGGKVPLGPQVTRFLDYSVGFRDTPRASPIRLYGLTYTMAS